jgi:hypothetical protein
MSYLCFAEQAPFSMQATVIIDSLGAKRKRAILPFAKAYDFIS